MTLATVLLIFALVLFVIAACSVNTGRLNATAAGLACLTAAMLAPLLR